MLKRAVDLAVAAPLCLLLAPVALAVAILVLVESGRPVLFTQRRPGLQGQPFLIYKFRTMHDARRQDGSPLSDAERLTRIGRILRKASLDELPELINVLRGEMSLVGPRPLLMEYWPLYSGEQRRRHDVRPGMTGWAQVNGRNAISWERKFELDLWYVEHQSLLLDLRILWMTLIRVVCAKDVSQAGHATAERFRGSRP